MKIINAQYTNGKVVECMTNKEIKEIWQMLPENSTCTFQDLESFCKHGIQSILFDDDINSEKIKQYIIDCVIEDINSQWTSIEDYHERYTGRHWDGNFIRLN